MIKGYWERRFDKRCDSIYLIDQDKNLSYTFEITVHHNEPMEPSKSTDFDSDDGQGIMKAFAEALQMGGYIPKSADDAELKATKKHLEDMQKISFSYLKYCNSTDD